MAPKRSITFQTSRPKKRTFREGSVGKVSLDDTSIPLPKEEDDGGVPAEGQHEWIHRLKRTGSVAATPVLFARDKIAAAGKSVYAPVRNLIREPRQTVCAACGAIKGPAVFIGQCICGIAVGAVLGISDARREEAREGADSHTHHIGSLGPSPDSLRPESSTQQTGSWSWGQTGVAVTVVAASFAYTRYAKARSEKEVSAGSQNDSEEPQKPEGSLASSKGISFDSTR